MAARRELALVRDVLDKQLVDRDGIPCGKIDGVVLDASGAGPPRVAFLESGPVTLARRLGAWPARVMARLARLGPRHGDPYLIPWRRVTTIGREVKLDLDAERSQLLAGERWLRHHLVKRLGGK